MLDDMKFGEVVDFLEDREALQRDLQRGSGWILDRSVGQSPTVRSLTRVNTRFCTWDGIILDVHIGWGRVVGVKPCGDRPGGLSDGKLSMRQQCALGPKGPTVSWRALSAEQLNVQSACPTVLSTTAALPQAPCAGLGTTISESHKTVSIQRRAVKMVEGSEG